MSRPQARRPADRDPTSPAPLLITADDALRDEALTAVAAAGSEAMVAPDVAAGLPSWPQASVVLLGIDRAGELLDRLPRTTRPLHVLGDRHDHEELCRLSAQLGAAIAVLPEQRGSLTEAIRDLAVDRARGSTVAVIGASGGVGGSTTAAGLAWRAHGRTVPTMLVDLDPYGGGLDLVLGIEFEPGWRWSHLADVSGGISDLADRLPRCEGLPVLSADRGGVTRPPGPATVRDVLASARSEHSLVVVDLGRGGDDAATTAARQDADTALLLVRDDVRGVAAAARLLDGDPGSPWQVALCRSPGADGLPPDAVADALGRQLVGTIPYDRSLRAAALRGDPPGAGNGRAWRRQLDRLLDPVVGP